MRCAVAANAEMICFACLSNRETPTLNPFGVHQFQSMAVLTAKLGLA